MSFKILPASQKSNNVHVLSIQNKRISRKRRIRCDGGVATSSQAGQLFRNVNSKRSRITPIWITRFVTLFAWFLITLQHFNYQGKLEELICKISLSSFMIIICFLYLTAKLNLRISENCAFYILHPHPIFF